MSRLILIEDEDVLREEIAGFLRESGYAVDAVSCLAEFDKTFVPGSHALALIDLGLPDGEGIDLIARLRAQGERLGIIVISARVASASRVTGLATGADHYLAKPLDLDELAAVVGALARRLGYDDACKYWTLNTALRQLVPPGGAPIDLTEQAFTVLRTIVEGKGQFVSRRKIVDALAADYMLYDQRRIDTQLYQLRKTVFDAAGIELPIRTARGQGYQFTGEVQLRA